MEAPELELVPAEGTPHAPYTQRPGLINLDERSNEFELFRLQLESDEVLSLLSPHIDIDGKPNSKQRRPWL